MLSGIEKKISAIETNKLHTLRGGAIASDSIALPFSSTTISFTTFKILLQASLCTFNVLCWYLPLRSDNFTSNDGLLSLANCFAGGIFVMLAMGHLIPEAIQVFTNLLPSGESASGVDYALQYTIVGFLGMLFIEKIAFDAEAIKSETNSDSMGTQAKTVAPSNSLWARLPVVKLNSAVVLCLAMSFHSFFEAAALGLAPDKISALLMASSIGLHQPAESLALLVAFVKQLEPKGSMTKKDIVWILSLFSCVGLVGVCAGVMIKSAAQGSMLEAAVLAVTAGTFLYVGATEIVSEEFEDAPWMTKVKRFLSYLVGIGVIKAMALISHE